MGWEKALIDLGNLGAAMLIIYLIAKMLFKYLETRSKADNSGVNKLCDRIDGLIDAFHATNLKMYEVLTTLVTDKEASKGQISIVLTKLDTVDKHISSVASELFTSFREQNNCNETRFNNLMADVKNLQVYITAELSNIKEALNKEIRERSNINDEL
jgi:hypothetical protein